MTLRRFLLLFAVPALCCTASLRGQMTQDALPESSASEPDPLGDTLPLIPEAPETTPQPEYEPDLPESSGVRRSIDPAKASETRLAIEQQQRQVKMRQVRIKAERNEGVQAALAQAKAAKTDAEKRYAMHLYYDRLYAAMLKIDPSLKQDDLKERKDTAVSPMSQDRLRPSVWAGAPEAAR